MDSAEIIVTTAGVLLIVFILWFFFGARDEDAVSHNSSGDAGNFNAPLYACPMHPWITSDDPAATCSICGMKLQKTDNASSA